MKGLHIIKHQYRPILVMLTMFLSSLSLEAQMPNIFKKATEVIKSGTETVASVGVLVNQVKRTTHEFDKSVVVDNSKTPQPMVAENQFTKPKFKKGAFTNIMWEPVSYFDGQLFPSMIISMADYKGDIKTPTMQAIKSSALGFRFNSKQSYIPIKWEIESTDKKFFDKISGDYVFQQAGQERYFMPEIPWNMSSLAKQTSSTPLNIIFRLFDEDGNKVEKSIPIFLRSVNDCIYQYKDLKLDFLFAAYIQEQHPEVDKVLRGALNTKIVKAIKGYQGDELETVKQVAAVWKVLHDRGFQYSSITTTAAAPDENIRSQQVRTFDSAIKTNQANCVDGTVVLASVLRAMGISTVMAFTSDHAFLGFYTSRGADKKLLFIETTMLANPDFLKALQVGSKQYDDYKAKNDIILIDVNSFRSIVRPLPF